MLVLATLLRKNKTWSKTKLRIFSIAGILYSDVNAFIVLCFSFMFISPEKQKKTTYFYLKLDVQILAFTIKL